MFKDQSEQINSVADINAYFIESNEDPLYCVTLHVLALINSANTNSTQQHLSI